MFKLDQPVASVDRMFYYGDKEIRSGGYVMENVCAPESLNVYSIVRTDDMRRRVYKNGSPADTQIWNGLTALAASGDGSVYAALASNTLQCYSEYYTTPAHLDAGWDLVVNGRVRSGKYGEPVWAKAYGSIIALMQQGDKLLVGRIK